MNRQISMTQVSKATIHKLLSLNELKNHSIKRIRIPNKMRRQTSYPNYSVFNTFKLNVPPKRLLSPTLATSFSISQSKKFSTALSQLKKPFFLQRLRGKKRDKSECSYQNKSQLKLTTNKCNQKQSINQGSSRLMLLSSPKYFVSKGLLCLKRRCSISMTMNMIKILRKLLMKHFFKLLKTDVNKSTAQLIPISIGNWTKSKIEILLIKLKLANMPHEASNPGQGIQLFPRLPNKFTSTSLVYRNIDVIDLYICEERINHNRYIQKFKLNNQVQDLDPILKLILKRPLPECNAFHTKNIYLTQASYEAMLPHILLLQRKYKAIPKEVSFMPRCTQIQSKKSFKYWSKQCRVNLFVEFVLNFLRKIIIKAIANRLRDPSNDNKSLVSSKKQCFGSKETSFSLHRLDSNLSSLEFEDEYAHNTIRSIRSNPGDVQQKIPRVLTLNFGLK